MRSVLAIGWDVGGWIGKKQGVAVATLGLTGPEWRGKSRTFRLTDLPSRNWDLPDLIRLYEVREVLEGLAARLATERQTPSTAEALLSCLHEHQEAVQRRHGLGCASFYFLRI